jgi:hypothetical protein
VLLLFTVSIKKNLNGRKIEPEKKTRFMKWKYVPAALLFTAAVACNNGKDSANKQDSGNTLNDTFPSGRHPDSLPPDSNPPDATKIDSGNRSTH